MKNILFAVLAILLVGLLSYSNSFQTTFQFDDYTSIIHNTSIRKLGDLNQIIQTAPGRAVVNFSFALNYHFAKLHTTSYHIFNFLIHIAVSLTVYWFIKLIIKSRTIKDKYKYIKYYPLTVAILFVSHPIQTQAVTYITQRITSMATLFYLLSLALYLKSSQSSKYFLFYYFGSIVSMFLALYSKENTFTLPLSILLIEVIFICTSMKEVKKRLFNFLPFFCLAIIIYLFNRSLFNPVSGIAKSEVIQFTGVNINMTRWEYFATQGKVLVTYMRLLIAPVNQNFDYDFPVTRSFANLPTILSFSLLIFILIFAFWVFKKNRIVSFGILFFFLTLSIESSIIPINDVINEHRLYLPSVGFFLVLISVLSIVIGTIIKKKKNIVFGTLILFLVSYYSYATFQRNKVWRNSVTLWSDVVKKSPNKGRAHFNLGGAYVSRGELSKGISEIKKAAELEPDYIEPYNSILKILSKQNP